MGELPKIISEFIVRDLNYIIGGSIVILSFLYRFGNFPDKDTPTVFYLFGAGIAYIIGYTLQDLFSIVRLVTTADVLKPWWPMQKFYWLFTRDKWKPIQELDKAQLRKAISEKRKKENFWAVNYERTISGMISAATMASCFLVSRLMLLSSWWGHIYCDKKHFAIAAGITLSCLSVILIVIARIRTLQYTRMRADLLDEPK
jgi:hypothetical protein